MAVSLRYSNWINPKGRSNQKQTKQQKEKEMTASEKLEEREFLRDMLSLRIMLDATRNTWITNHQNGVGIILNRNYDLEKVDGLLRVVIDDGGDADVNDLLGKGFVLIRVQTESKKNGSVEAVAYLVEPKEKKAEN